MMIKVHLNQIKSDGVRLVGAVRPSDMQLEDDELVKFPKDIEYDVFVNIISGGVTAEAELRTEIACVCGRCLVEFNRRVEVKGVIHFYENTSSEEIDLTPDLREDILITFPQNFICGDECKGLCPQCGCNKNAGECNCRIEESSGEIWKDLEGLFK